MTELVLLHHNEPMTTSLALAEGTENTHESVIKLVRKYVDDLQEFGTFGFEIQKSGGRPTEIAYLNESQATLLITYMRNNEIVRRFKIALVKAFYELRAAVSPAPTFQSVDHQADLMVAADRTFRAILRSARAAGLRLPQALQRANAITVRNTGVDMLAAVGITPQVMAAPNDAEGVSAFVGGWLAGELPLPTTICKSADLYRAYVYWRRLSGAPVINIEQFFRLAIPTSPVLKKRHVTAVEGGISKTVRAIVVAECDRENRDGERGRYTATELQRFALALSDWING